jgi:hypothetical protein
MECPSCGFHQPEDLYCAHCGVHIPTALSRRKRRTMMAVGATGLALVLIGAGAALWWMREPPAPHTEPQEERQTIPRIQPPPPLPEPAGLREKKATSAGKSAPSATRKGRPPARAPGPEGQGTASQTNSSLPQAPEPDPEAQLKRWAAQEWVDRARELADDPEQEMEMYRRALEVDPSFSVAHYHLGMAHWRKGERETAIEEFRKFWQNVSQEERQQFPLPEEVLPEETAASQGDQPRP